VECDHEPDRASRRFFVLPATQRRVGRPDVVALRPARDQSAAGLHRDRERRSVGATFDNDPLNQPVVDGRPLYAGVTYAAGVRAERISNLIEAGNASLTIDDMARIQHDTRSNVGAKLTPAVVAALAFVADPTGAPADVAPYLAALPAADQARLAAARQLLGSWSFETPTTAASLEHPGDSAATALFNTWMHFFLTRAMQDEYTAASFDMWRLDDNFLVRVA